MPIAILLHVAKVKSLTKGDDESDFDSDEEDRIFDAMNKKSAEASAAAVAEAQRKKLQQAQSLSQFSLSFSHH